MTLACPRRRLAFAALAFALAASPRPAAAQMPPPDFPPLPMLPGGAPAAPAPPSAVPTAPGRPVTPPVAPALPPGYGYGYPYGYGAPPGYGPPGGYPYPVSPDRYGPLRPGGESDPSAVPPPPPRRRYSDGLFAGGVVAVLGGMTAVLIGAYFVSSGTDRIEIYCDTPPSIPCAHKDDATRVGAGAALMGIGAAVGAAGLPMWFVGSRYVTIPKEEKKAALRPEVRVGAGSASVTLRF